MDEHRAQEKSYISEEAVIASEESNSVLQCDSQSFVSEQKQNVVQQSWKPFGCETCGKRFTLKGSLKTHEKLHGFRPTYNCDVCGKSFKVANGLKAHAVLHSGQKPFHCEVCGKTFTLKGSLKTHSALHSEARDSFPCYICGKMYKGKASLKSHAALHAGKQPFLCEVCDQNCTHSSLRLHAEFYYYHKPYVCQDSDTIRIPQPPVTTGDASVVPNMKTDVIVQPAASFDFWHRFPHLFQGYDMPERVTSPQPAIARECPKKEICGLSCESPSFSMLTANHSDDLTFYIGQSLVHKYSRTKPPPAVRNKPFTCEMCGKKFTLRGSLKTHEKLHSFRQSYHCHLCGKSFKVEGGLKSHAVLHTNHRPFLCIICGKGFTLKGSLKTHLSLHSIHRATYPCDICGKTYKGRASYDSHKAQHLGHPLYQCEVCGKNFTLKGSLKLHSMLHSGLKPYTCQICGMGFAVRSHLTRHFRMHSLQLSLTARGQIV